MQTANSRKRVVASIYKEAKANTYYDAARHYVYDVSGNVKTLFQEMAALKSVEGSAGNGIRQINYDYDLISGKVNRVVYQPGKGDQFIYRYEYDAENRIKIAYTSRNGLLLQEDAYYEYYQHGPLARVELGQHKVQGVDYAYTLQGWLKGINSVALDATKDMGGDGNAGGIYEKFGRDVYGYSLGYHSSDYKPIGGSAANAFAVTFTAPGSVGSGNTGAQLFNGNISNTTVALSKINSGAATGYSYLYDQLNRLLGMKQHNISGTSWSYSTFNAAYEEKFSYDANGNIKTLVRKGANITGMPLAMDNLKYYYYYTNTGNARAEFDPTVALPSNVNSLSNQLARVTDSDPAGNYTDDIDSQPAGYYDYDNIGNLIKEGTDITGIEWTVYGKIKQIKKGTVTIKYGYDPSGNRIYKEVVGAPGGTTRQFYIRDAQGNTLALYNGKTTHVEWAEQHLYGSSRLGVWNYGKFVPAVPGAVSYDSMMIGSVNYELTNHLGNVLSVISDKKVGVSAGGTTVDYYRAEVVSQNDYYAFGSLMPGRKYSVANTNYRYGFNGQEKSLEINADGNSTTAEFWQYESRLGRRWNMDPVLKSEESPYLSFSGNPILFSDIKGDDAGYELAGNTITIKARIFVVGEKVTARKIRDIQAQLSKVYKESKVKADNGKIYTVKFDIKVSLFDIHLKNDIAESKKEGSYNYVRLMPKDESSSNYSFGAGYYGQWNEREENAVWAHEFGHMLGFDESYYTTKSGGVRKYSEREDNDIMGPNSNNMFYDNGSISKLRPGKKALKDLANYVVETGKSKGKIKPWDKEWKYYKLPFGKPSDKENKDAKIDKTSDTRQKH